MRDLYKTRWASFIGNAGVRALFNLDDFDTASGKTTFLKILLGLYVPNSGTLTLNEIAVADDTRDSDRQYFSVIFSDFFLFKDLTTNLNAPLAESYLERFGLKDKVRVIDDQFSTLDLSAGQRKRLALAHAMLERRPVFVTDEWAADQDPEFRSIFYEVILPEMRRAGLTSIIVSHDDRYFHVADRIIRFENGNIV